ncbi:hypothetical protein HWV62_27075 [Athelia sp. TMB]|nr:hypothetical protein HWV62_27075 [Athelia sp. TMB]
MNRSLSSKMDPAAYKNLTVSRGFNYHYFISPARDGKPTILFLHGFPSTSSDWRHQVIFFRNLGYGVIVPDLLGYGGTSKPLDPAEYNQSLITKDVIDILDAEKIDKVISVGHDWGSVVNSRLINFFPERISAASFLAVGYIPPKGRSNWRAALEQTKNTFGREVFGYQLFFVEDDAAEIIEKHWDSFHSLMWPAEPETWIEHVGPTGAAKAWVLADTKTALPAYLTEEDKAAQTAVLLKDGFQSSLNWYKPNFSDLAAKDAELIPLENYDIKQPVLFIACSKDFVGVPAIGYHALSTHAKNLKTTELDAGHWVLLSHPTDVNRELLSWIQETL